LKFAASMLANLLTLDSVVTFPLVDGSCLLLGEISNDILFTHLSGLLNWIS
jgi:hypothetical protein